MPANAGYIYVVPGDWACYIHHAYMDISREKLQDLTEIIEDTVQYFCDINQASGQLTWLCVESLATAKHAELNGELVEIIS